MFWHNKMKQPCYSLFSSLAALYYLPFFTRPLIFLKKSNTMTALFIISLAVFVYMCYVLIKPEKF
ncbi:potassium-transporting ATPase subunit F [Ferruginibacter profundus]